MRTYRTKDTGEAIALELLGIEQTEAPSRIATTRDLEENKQGSVHWFFEDSLRREEISLYFTDQYRKGGVDWIKHKLEKWIFDPHCPLDELFDEIVSAITCHVMRMRKTKQQLIPTYGVRMED